MRVVCVHANREPVPCGTGPVTVGSAPDDGVTLTGAGVAPHHLSLVEDARGLVLVVSSGCQRIYVNARAVRECALLRYGDTVTLGASKFCVTTDSPPPPPDANAGVATSPQRVALRIMSGREAGRLLPISRELELGAGTPYFSDLAYRCSVRESGEGVTFESASGQPTVNGWHCSAARLSSGDQLVLTGHRLVVEAPGLQYAAHAAALPAAPMPADPGPDNTPSSVGIWWLIVAAAILAAVIALLLYFHG